MGEGVDGGAEAIALDSHGVAAVLHTRAQRGEVVLTYALLDILRTWERHIRVGDLAELS